MTSDKVPTVSMAETYRKSKVHMVLPKQDLSIKYKIFKKVKSNKVDWLEALKALII